MKTLAEALVFALVFTFFGSIRSAGPAQAGQAQASVFLEQFSRKRASIQYVSGYLHSPILRVEERPTLDYWQNNLRLGYIMTDILKEGSLWRGNIQGLLEVTYSTVLKGPGDHMAGITLLFRYNLLRPGWRWVPYLQVGAGVVYNDIYNDDAQGLVGQALEFTPQASAGLRYMINRKWSIDLEAMFHHVSNAGLDDRNIGVNSGGGFLGLTCYLSRP